jgi:hypothetical protein
VPLPNFFCYTAYVHLTQTLVGQIAAVMAVLQAIPYIYSILFGTTRPSRASYAIWSVIQTSGLISYLAAGATTTKWTSIVLTLNAIIIFTLSLKYGMGGFNKFDIPCLILAGLAIVLWATTRNPALAVYMNTLAGFIGYLPTIKKAYFLPRSESTLSWSMYMAATTINVSALTSTKLAIMLPPLCGFILSSTVAGLLLFPRLKFKNLPRRLQAVPTKA